MGSLTPKARRARSGRATAAGHFNDLIQSARDIVLLRDASLRVVDCNDAALAAYGYSRDELLALEPAGLRAPEARAGFEDDFNQAAEAGGKVFETLHRRKDGSVFPVEVATQVIELGGQRYYPAFIRDISERKNAERQLKHLTRLYALVSSASAAIVRAGTEKELFDKVCRIAVEQGGMFGAVVRIADEQAGLLRPVAWSESMRAVAAQLVVSTDPSSPESRTLAGIAYREGRVIIDNDFKDENPNLRWRVITLAAGMRSVAVLPLRRAGKPIGVVVLNASEPDFFDTDMLALLGEMAENISFALDNFEGERRRRQAEAAVQESEERFRVLVEQSIAGITIVQDGRIAYMNPRCAQIFGYTPEELTGKPPAITVAEEDRELVAENIRKRLSGETPSMQYTFRGLRRDGSIVTVGVHGAVANVDRRPAIIGLMQDISERERAKQQVEAYAQQLEGAMLGTVNAVSTLCEMRDPYTAGHEKRVGALARRLGEELGMSEGACRGLEITGGVHDLGKVSIPTEILNRPGKLSALEFEIIQAHPRTGFDVLKIVAFPWPLAQTVLQHHERMDGSGYPGGLKGEEIILEARILAVADVVEAIASHRPYRPALGIGAALEEIEKFRGVRYDAQVVDACLRLFREKGYSLPD